MSKCSNSFQSIGNSIVSKKLMEVQIEIKPVNRTFSFQILFILFNHSNLIIAIGKYSINTNIGAPRNHNKIQSSSCCTPIQLGNAAKIYNIVMAKTEKVYFRSFVTGINGYLCINIPEVVR